MTTKNPAEAHLKQHAAEGIALSDAELKAARKEGAKEDVKETAKEVHRSLTDGNLPGEEPSRQYHGHDEIQPWAHNLDLGIDAFEKAISNKPSDNFIPDEKVYGLLALERNGKNRTPYVKAMIKRLGLKVKGAADLPGGGPGHTNDITNITDL
jgi:hypothetical protein